MAMMSDVTVVSSKSYLISDFFPPDSLQTFIASIFTSLTQYALVLLLHSSALKSHSASLKAMLHESPYSEHCSLHSSCF